MTSSALVPLFIITVLSSKTMGYAISCIFWCWISQIFFLNVTFSPKTILSKASLPERFTDSFLPIFIGVSAYFCHLHVQCLCSCKKYFNSQSNILVCLDWSPPSINNFSNIIPGRYVCVRTPFHNTRISNNYLE